MKSFKPPFPVHSPKVIQSARSWIQNGHVSIDDSMVLGTDISGINARAAKILADAYGNKEAREFYLRGRWIAESKDKMNSYPVRAIYARCAKKLVAE